MGLFVGLSVCLLITECRVDGDGVVGGARVGFVHVGHHQRVGEGAGEVNIHRCLVHPERKNKIRRAKCCETYTHTTSAMPVILVMP